VKSLCALTLGFGLFFCATAQSQESPQPLKLVQTIVLPGVEGRFDHMSVDVKGKRLFIAALGNETVEVIDLAARKPLHTIGGLKDPQGVLYVPESNVLFVADGELGACNIYDGSSYQLIRSITSLKDADNIRYDALGIRTFGAAYVHVAYGDDTNGGIRTFDSRDGKPVSEVLLDAKPESFQVEKITPSRRIFANVPTRGYIAVINTSKRRVVEKWPVEGFKPFYPMALDETNHRLFIGSRNPPALVVFDTTSGRIVTSVEAAAQTDDLFYDAVRKRLYMSTGEGIVIVFEQRDADHYSLLAKVPSVPGATTSFYVPEFNRLFVPASPYAGQPAKVLVFEAQ
jgi:DNA-binding beta-propeller fold protein YncE